VHEPTAQERDAMSVALDEARAAGAAGDVPVGAVVLIDGRVVSRAGNQRELLDDPTAHAEVLALRAAAEATGSWRLTDATLVVTLEPCPMCAGALVGARVRRLVYGAVNTDNGACGTLYNLCADPRLNHEVEVVHGVEAEAAAALLGAFFAARRPRPGRRSLCRPPADDR
jgi:tRNA(adenine34) deaminase